MLLSVHADYTDTNPECGTGVGVVADQVSLPLFTDCKGTNPECGTGVGVVVGQVMGVSTP